MSGSITVGGKILASHDNVSGKLSMSENVDMSNMVFPAGHVIQVVTDLKTVGNTSNGTDIESVTITATSFALGYTTNSLTITPKYSNSKILLMFDGQVSTTDVSGVGFEIFFAKDGNQLLNSGSNKSANMFNYMSGTSTYLYWPTNASYSFISGQTTPMTLSIVITKYASAGPVFLQHDGTHHLIAMEIAQ